MSSVRPFSGQIVEPDWAEQVVSPAYDSLTVSQRQAFRSENPNSYLHVTRSAEDEEDGDVIDSTTLVRRGRESLDRLLDMGAFGDPSDPPAFHVYRLSLDDHSQLGLICEIDPEYFAAVARPHEATQPQRAALLAEHFSVVAAASSPVACAVRDQGGLQAALSAATYSDPVLDVYGTDGLRQTVWRIDGAELTAEIHANVDATELYIIDGHHRAAANRQLLESGAELPMLAAIFPEHSLRLVGFHRLVRLPEALKPPDFLHAIARRFRVERVDFERDVAPGQVSMVVDGSWYRVHFDERPIRGGALIRLGSLDPVVLEREILRSVVGRYAEELDVTFMPDAHDYEDIVAQADRQGRVPIFVAPVSIEDLVGVARGGLIMPAKSTYFTPKVRSGIFLRRYE